MDLPDDCSKNGVACDDYEPCGECGYDHSYEPQEAARAHQDLIPEQEEEEG